MLELIGLQEDLVERTCRKVMEHREGSDLSATAVVFPSKRFGFFLRHELSRALAGNFFPPALFSIEAFFEALYKMNFPGGASWTNWKRAMLFTKAPGRCSRAGCTEAKESLILPRFSPGRRNSWPPWRRS